MEFSGLEKKVYNIICLCMFLRIDKALQRRHPNVESDESLGYHWGSWLGDGIQPLDGLTEGDEANSLELSLLLSLAGERAASSPAAEHTNRN